MSPVIAFQTDVDDWIKQCNETRPHSGKYCFGKTPLKTLLESKHLADEKMLNSFVSKEGFSGTPAVGDNAQRCDISDGIQYWPPDTRMSDQV